MPPKRAKAATKRGPEPSADGKTPAQTVATPLRRSSRAKAKQDDAAPQPPATPAQGTAAPTETSMHVDGSSPANAHPPETTMIEPTPTKVDAEGPVASPAHAEGDNVRGESEPVSDDGDAETSDDDFGWTDLLVARPDAAADGAQGAEAATAGSTAGRAIHDEEDTEAAVERLLAAQRMREHEAGDEEAGEISETPVVDEKQAETDVMMLAGASTATGRPTAALPARSVEPAADARRSFLPTSMGRGEPVQYDDVAGREPMPWRPVDSQIHKGKRRSVRGAIDEVELARRRAEKQKRADAKRERKRKAREARAAAAALAQNDTLPDASGVMVIIDTNIILAHQAFLHYLRDLIGPPVQILVPKAVLKELDILKLQREREIEVSITSKVWKKEKMASVARDATKWLLKATEESADVVIQRMDDEAHDQMKSRNADARILSFALRLQKRAATEGGTIILLSNDNLLRLNARSEGIGAYGTKDVRGDPRMLLSKIAPTYKIPDMPPPDASAAIAAAASSGKLLASDGTPAQVMAPAPPPAQLVYQTAGFTYTTGNQPAAATKALGPKPPPAKYWPTASAVPSPMPPAGLVGPDAELAKHRGLVKAPGRCAKCGNESGKTIKASPTFSHYACMTCLQVICRGCWKTPGCDWGCQSPYNGDLCAATTCCGAGRAIWLFEVLSRLDPFTRTPPGPFRLHLKYPDSQRTSTTDGDIALTQFLIAIKNVLPRPMSGKDPRAMETGHPSMGAMLHTSALPEVLSSMLSEPYERWATRRAVYVAAFDVIHAICESPPAVPILLSRLIKTSTSGLRSFVETRGKVSWAYVPPADELAAFPGLANDPSQRKPLCDVIVAALHTASTAIIDLEALPADSEVTEKSVDILWMLEQFMDVGEHFLAAVKAHQTALKLQTTGTTDPVAAAAGTPTASVESATKAVEQAAIAVKSHEAEQMEIDADLDGEPLTIGQVEVIVGT